MIPEQVITAFRSALRGKLLLPGNEGYDYARTVYNGMIDKHPMMIAQCADVADVITAVRFSQDNQLLPAVRGGGHNGAGMGTCDDSIVIDLSAMKSVYVDVNNQTVRAEGGCTLADLDHATHPLGLAVPAGIFSSTGVGGLTLGGGLGHLTRKYGLTIDNLLEATVVLADGSYIIASADKHPDLFWALRGGGGNFGIVVSFLFKAHPVDIVYGGPMLWEMTDAKEIMQWFRQFTVEAPEDINCFFAMLTVPPAAPFPEELWLKKMCAVIWCCASDETVATRYFNDVRSYKKPVVDWAGPIPFPVLQSLFDATLPRGLQQYWKGEYMNALPDEVIALHLQHAAEAPTWRSTMHLYPINGAASRIGPKDTAWNFRHANWATVIVAVGDTPGENKHIIKWAKDYAQALDSYTAGGAYVNFMMDEGEEKVKRSYAGNYNKLAKIKLSTIRLISSEETKT